MIRYALEPDMETKTLGVRLLGTSEITFLPPVFWGEAMQLIGQEYAYSLIVSQEHMNALGKIVDHVTGGKLTQSTILRHLMFLPPDALRINDPDGRLFRDLIDAVRTPEEPAKEDPLPGSM